MLWAAAWGPRGDGTAVHVHCACVHWLGLRAPTPVRACTCGGTRGRVDALRHGLVPPPDVQGECLCVVMDLMSGGTLEDVIR